VIRLAWRQFRAQGLVALAALLAVAGVALLTGPPLAHLYDTTLTRCASADNCDAAVATFSRTHEGLQVWWWVLSGVAPLLVGMFWGAPLIAREFEAGTHRLIWTQSVGRARWLVVKLAVVGLAAMATAGLLSLIVTWWARPLDRAAGDPFSTFAERGVVPVAYAAFAFALGAAGGLLIRRTLPAMAASLVAYVTVRLSFGEWWRPGLIGPLHRDVALDPATTGYGASGGPLAFFTDSTLDPEPPRIPGAWITSIRVVDGAGHGLTTRYLAAACPGLGQGDPSPAGPGGAHHQPVPDAAVRQMHDCVTRIGAVYHEAVTYQPAGRYWAFQWIEFSVFLGAALALGGLCLWMLRRRAS